VAAGVEEPLPIVFVSSGAKLGGEERYLALLLEGLGPAWVQDVVCLEHGPFVERLRKQGYPVEVLPTSKRAVGIVLSAFRLRRRLGRSRPRLVHANGVKAALVSALATVGSPTPVLWAKHDFSWDGWIARAVGRRCRQIVGVSEAVTRTFRARTKAKVRVVHNGIEPPEVDYEPARRGLLDALGPPEPRAVIALVGRIVPSKGHRDLVAVLPEIARAVPGVRVAFLGSEQSSHVDYAAALRREVRAAALDGVVAFLGHRDDAVELISGCDVLVVPSGRDERGMDTEGFPYAGLEAMAVGTPVAGYAYGGLPELLGECGRLAPPGDRPALRDAILALLSDITLTERLAECGRRRASAEFSFARVLSAMKEHYRQAANSSR
jgi:glycosyltransferase involved in cell wall biosynthesis